MRPADAAYAAAIRTVIERGTVDDTRMPGVRACRYSGLQMEFDLTHGFPLLELKTVPYRLVCVELAWMLAGRTNVSWLQARRCHIWDADAEAAPLRGFSYSPGELGPVYGKQWRRFGANAVDQVSKTRAALGTDPTSRRLLVSAWNPDEVDRAVLPPCHYAWQVFRVQSALDMVVTMRSGDLGLGLPFNIASYATLLCLLANEHHLQPRRLVFHIGDAHVYETHRERLLQRLDTFASQVSGRGPATPIAVDLQGHTVDDFIAAHEADVKHAYVVHNYNPDATLPLTLHT